MNQYPELSDNSKTEPFRVMRVIARMNIGGPAIQISNLCKYMSKEDFDQRLYTGFCAENEIEFLDSMSGEFSVYRVPGLGRRIRISEDLRALLFLIREIRTFKPHLIHTHTSKAGLLGRLASLLSLYPSIRVHTYHGHILAGYFNGLTTRLIVIAERLLSFSTTHILAVGEQVRQDLLLKGIGNPTKFSIMPPGVNLGELPDRSKSNSFYGLSEEKLKCGFVGRVTKVKRPDRFLQVVAELVKREVDLTFFIAGDGDLLDECRERILRENLPVAILGWQRNIEQVFSIADIVVVTSDNEGTPLSLIQAGLAGIPAVSTNVGSVSDVIESGRTGLITNLEVSNIADALETLSKDEVLRTTMGAEAKKYAQKNFSIERFICDHEELYRKLIINQAKFSPKAPK